MVRVRFGASATRESDSADALCGLLRGTSNAEFSGEQKGTTDRRDSMTNTLHRYGDSESFYYDYLIFASPSGGNNDAGSVPKLKAFLEMARPFNPVNIGDPVHG